NWNCAPNPQARTARAEAATPGNTHGGPKAAARDCRGAASRDTARLSASLHAVHPALDQRRDQEQQHA
ncbi:hypothetical protein COI89_19800, partial [Bacillus cereus]